jgi:hypothetical protein
MSVAWYYRFPGVFHTYGPVRFEQPVNEQFLRAHIRKVWELSRLPRGFECWTTSD